MVFFVALPALMRVKMDRLPQQELFFWNLVVLVT
jgi:hypothetical protein